jgi:uncharacterized protein
LFLSFYVATLFVLGWVRFPLPQVGALLASAIATFVSILLWEHRGSTFYLGLLAPPLTILRESALGLLSGVVIIGSCALLVVASTDVRHEPGSGFPWRELWLVFLPAALHEELLFRGYPFQKLLAWHRGFALLFVAFVFAVLHGRNSSVTVIGLTNIFLGGLLLGLAYELFRRLWFPIGLHLAWNLMSGPIIGHEVSGYRADRTVFVERGSGPSWLTGGDFGIEGSAWMTLVEVIAIVLLNRIVRRRVSAAGC